MVRWRAEWKGRVMAAERERNLAAGTAAVTAVASALLWACSWATVLAIAMAVRWDCSWGAESAHLTEPGTHTHTQTEQIKHNETTQLIRCLDLCRSLCWSFARLL